MPGERDIKEADFLRLREFYPLPHGRGSVYGAVRVWNGLANLMAWWRCGGVDMALTEVRKIGGLDGAVGCGSVGVRKLRTVADGNETMGPAP